MVLSMLSIQTLRWMMEIKHHEVIKHEKLKLKHRRSPMLHIRCFVVDFDSHGLTTTLSFTRTTTLPLSILSMSSITGDVSGRRSPNIEAVTVVRLQSRRSIAIVASNTKHHVKHQTSIRFPKRTRLRIVSE
jgi:hypothetical protein